MVASSFLCWILIPLFASTANASPVRDETRAILPTVVLDSATFTGTTDGIVSRFLGIPFAQPPIGNLRFRKPVPVNPYTGINLAASFGPSCTQQSSNLPFSDVLPPQVVTLLGGLTQVISTDSEDCLTINVVKPASATSTSKLPVVVWIYGGGFLAGGSSTYDGGIIVQHSVLIGQPVIYVSMNYRLSAWGFLGGNEAKAAGVGNLGLQDQREALRWIQKYISAFGGDPSKVTIWGESAGSISVALQMITDAGNPRGLFRGAFMQSGSPISTSDISQSQAAFDDLAAKVNCSGSSDKIQCLREAPYAILKAAINDSPGLFDYSSLSTPWGPRVDGEFTTENPIQLVNLGKFAKVPYITGDLDDEGTLFSLSTLNITTDDQFREWVTQYYLPSATAAEVDQVLSLYPSEPSAGSPYSTGLLNTLTPQFKRIASFQGDLVFQSPRRFLLSKTAGTQKTWAYLSKELKATPLLGSFHSSDLLNVYGAGELKDYLIRFTANLDPNVGPFNIGLTVAWPEWTPSSKLMLLLNDGVVFDVAITTDTYREAPISHLTQLSLKYTR